VAPQVGFEPTTLRLTAGCSAIELLRNSGGSHRTARSGAMRGVPVAAGPPATKRQCTARLGAGQRPTVDRSLVTVDLPLRRPAQPSTPFVFGNRDHALRQACLGRRTRLSMVINCKLFEERGRAKRTRSTRWRRLCAATRGLAAMLSTSRKHCAPESVGPRSRRASRHDTTPTPAAPRQARRRATTRLPRQPSDRL
jgi:hypothetical protein